jgi:hypothetical protein
MKREFIRFANNAFYDAYNMQSTNDMLSFELYDVDKNVLESVLTGKDNLSIIKYLQKDMETLGETLLKAYSGYVNFEQMLTRYGVVTNIDYETQDDSTQSGFAEESHDITTITLRKPSQVESELKKLKEAQTIQDGAIADIAGMISDIADGQILQDDAIADVAETVSDMSAE